MERFPKKLIWLAIILVAVVWFSPFLVQAETTRIVPGNAVNLEVGIGGFNQVKGGIVDYIGQIYVFATAIVGGLAVVMIIIGAVQYSASAGNKAALGSAKETITSAIIGLVIVLMAYLILGTFSGSFVNLVNPRLKVLKIEKPTPTPSASVVPPANNNLICVVKADGKGGECRLNAGGVQYDPACKSIGQDCTTVTPPPPVKDCPDFRTPSTCVDNGQIDCRWCSSSRLCMTPGYYKYGCRTSQVP